MTDYYYKKKDYKPVEEEYFQKKLQYYRQFDTTEEDSIKKKIQKQHEEEIKNKYPKLNNIHRLQKEYDYQNQLLKIEYERIQNVNADTFVEKHLKIKNKKPIKLPNPDDVQYLKEFQDEEQDIEQVRKFYENLTKKKEYQNLESFKKIQNVKKNYHSQFFEEDKKENLQENLQYHLDKKINKPSQEQLNEQLFLEKKEKNEIDQEYLKLQEEIIRTHVDQRKESLPQIYDQKQYYINKYESYIDTYDQEREYKLQKKQEIERKKREEQEEYEKFINRNVKLEMFNKFGQKISDQHYEIFPDKKFKELADQRQKGYENMTMLEQRKRRIQYSKMLEKLEEEKQKKDKLRQVQGSGQLKSLAQSGLNVFSFSQDYKNKIKDNKSLSMQTSANELHQQLFKNNKLISNQYI